MAFSRRIEDIDLSPVLYDGITSLRKRLWNEAVSFASIGISKRGSSEAQKKTCLATLHALHTRTGARKRDKHGDGGQSFLSAHMVLYANSASAMISKAINDALEFLPDYDPPKWNAKSLSRAVHALHKLYHVVINCEYMGLMRISVVASVVEAFLEYENAYKAHWWCSKKHSRAVLDRALLLCGPDAQAELEGIVRAQVSLMITAVEHVCKRHGDSWGLDEDDTIGEKLEERSLFLSAQEVEKLCTTLRQAELTMVAEEVEEEFELQKTISENPDDSAGDIDKSSMYREDTSGQITFSCASGALAQVCGLLRGLARTALAAGNCNEFLKIVEETKDHAAPFLLMEILGGRADVTTNSRASAVMGAAILDKIGTDGELRAPKRGRYG